MKIKKKIKTIAKGVEDKTKTLVGKANTKRKKTIVFLKKEWEKEKPHREQYKKELKNAVKLVAKDVVRIGADVMNTIKNDIRKTNHRK